ncbi:MAG: riboflavin synthase [Clostridium sp.]|nr:riboflavin synthase [Clostridium sp.]MCM1547909.1 riboflavin synthase [Ruminococcus sp.]
MFTGIIEETGIVSAVKKGAKQSGLIICADKIFSDLKIGDSVAVNGVCLTAAEISGKTFTSDVMNETFSRSNLSLLRQGNRVNLERAMPANGRFGGHIVSGHVDGTGTVTDITKDGNAVWYTVSAESSVMRYIVEKGSVTIDGISLTVARTTDKTFSVSIIPHTAKETILSDKKCGDKVNLENDIIAKYTEKLLGIEKTFANSGITREFLSKHGY